MNKISNNQLSFSEKALVVFSYILFFPSFSIIFTDRRMDEQLAFHGGQAMFLWLFMIIVVVALKALAAWGSVYIDVSFLGIFSSILFFAFWLYVLKCSFVFLMGKSVNIPVISNISDRLA
ncbi:MAG: hypothetical protein WC527_07495 [Candidatus Margulisiibacteriota bacterium]